jgi:hypothetical protein
MPETTITKPDGTQVTQRTQPVVPALDVSCQAIVTTQVAICEPMSDGSWLLVTAFEDNYNIVLDHRDKDEAKREVINRLMEIKQQWQDKGRIISLENLLMNERPPSMKMGQSPPSSAPVAAETS